MKTYLALPVAAILALATPPAAHAANVGVSSNTTGSVGIGGPSTTGVNNNSSLHLVTPGTPSNAGGVPSNAGGLPTTAGGAPTSATGDAGTSMGRLAPNGTAPNVQGNVQGSAATTLPSGANISGLSNFSNLDTNRDGTVSAAEYAAGGSLANGRTFQSLDTNHDGTISQTELDAGITPGIVTPAPAGSANAAVNAGGGVPNGTANPPSTFQSLDIDHNGVVTPGELNATYGMQGGIGILQKFDTDHNGGLSQSEWNAYAATGK